MASNAGPNIDLIEDKQRRCNQKSKRTRTLIRKAIEASQKCDLDIFLIVHDREYSKIIEYNSTKEIDESASAENITKFDLQRAQAVLE